MGYSRWDSSTWRGHSAGHSGLRREEIFRRRSLDRDLDPRGVRMRESRDSTFNPQSNAVIVALDVTGSMGMVAEVIARQGLGTLVEEMLVRLPVSDPHLLFMGVGDVKSDQAPLQVTQFEADIRIAQQLERIWLEGGGGGNNSESYALPWYFAARRTAIDCHEKRGRRGYLFTIGDEMPPEPLTAQDIWQVFGDEVSQPISAAAALAMAEQRYHCFHIVAEEGSYARAHPDRVVPAWRDFMGQRVLRLADHRRVAELIVSAIAINEGANPRDVAASWNGDAGDVVGHAFGGAPSRITGVLGDWFRRRLP
ncbi:hypothetical protein [Reyranella sp.]|uniref:hypothetical protein n=1 Tax=Reyranella sp. TaxID=1929291 RepID=UPI003BAC6E68